MEQAIEITAEDNPFNFVAVPGFSQKGQWSLSDCLWRTGRFWRVF
jgi:hypothetical protein